MVAALLATPALAQENNEILNGYEQVSKALVADDLPGAQKAAGELATKMGGQGALGEHATEIAKSNSLESAREHFKALSQEAIKLGQGQKDWNVVTCPMVKDGEWLQKGETVANPYMGKKMSGCGMIKKGGSAQNAAKPNASCCGIMMGS